MRHILSEYLGIILSQSFSVSTNEGIKGSPHCTAWSGEEYGGHFQIQEDHSGCKIVRIGSTTENTTEDCCRTKSVGGLTYQLVDRWKSVYKNCKDGCIYRKIDENSDTRYCFAKGNKKVMCHASYLSPRNK